LLGSAAVGAESVQPDEQAVREVLSGKRKVAHALWWGFRPEDATNALQAAINSGAEKVIVHKMPSPWIVDRIELAGNQEVVFEPGVVVLAKKGAFRGPNDALFTAWGRSNLKLTGYGATLRMHRSDYAGPDYKKAEWRHVLNFRGCTNVTVAGLTLAESGGDGIYLGSGRNGEPNRNVTIRDVVCDRNYRQGISVINAEKLLIEDCVLKNTAGTPPAAGIDFEPNCATERLADCVMRRCVIENNQGYALVIYARPLDASSAPISIRVEDCITRGTNARSASIVTSCGSSGAVKGLIEFVNCRFEDVGRAGITIGSKPPGGVRLRFLRCTLADPSDRPTTAAPILFSTHKGDLGDIGGVEFLDCTLVELVSRPVMQLNDATGARLLDVTGTLSVRRGSDCVKYTLDQKLIDQWIPFDPVVGIRPVSLEGVRFERVSSAAPVGGRQVSGARVREEATYLLWAGRGQEVSLRLAHEPVGRSQGKPLAVGVFSPAGKQIQTVTIAFPGEADCKFTAAETGSYRIVCQPGTHTVRVLAATHPICIAGWGGQIHLLGTTGEWFFRVPSGTREFGIRVRGEGDGERVSAAVFDATGKLRWQRQNIGPAQSLHIQRDPAQQDEIWRLRLTRPTLGVLEDVYLDFRAIPAVIALHADDLLRPSLGPHP